MITYRRVCLENITIKDVDGNQLHLKEGEEYITSDVDDNDVLTVFSTYWVQIKAKYFSYGERFT